MFFRPFTQFSKQLDAGVPDGQVSRGGHGQDGLHHEGHYLILFSGKKGKFLKWEGKFLKWEGKFFKWGEILTRGEIRQI